MAVYLLQMKVNGIKNIYKEIVLNFYNKTLKQEFELNDSNIKSIYGPNGSGKSGLINAVDIYKKLVINENFLSDSSTIKLLDEMVNKRNNRFSMEMSFLLYDEKDGSKSDVYTHRIELEKDTSGYFKIAYEKIMVTKGNFFDGTKGKIVIEIKNGVVINTGYPDLYGKIEKYVLNLLEKRSIVNILWERYPELKSDEKLVGYVSVLMMPIILSVEIDVIVNESDTHYDYLMKHKVVDFPNFFKNLVYSKTRIRKDTDVIRKEDFNEYKDNILRLENFIKIFKPDLQAIEVDSKEDSDILLCEKYFCYDGYRVHSEFESTGIKKLIELFNAFCNVTNGKIVFIDEIDANLHDVYLCKLIEYFSMYAKGQLCFTTHNLTPMEVLKKRNYSIDFLSDKSTLTSWKKNGNSSVSKYYREGMIQNSPFNIEAFDFIGLFEED